MKHTRILNASPTLFDNIYILTKCSSFIQSTILTLDISDHLPIMICN
ncbi:hypothetical protein LSH36_273g00000 [Paralvinella palmiformis]|uniref:Uncharacterized protein n=1 Tax=Paralvinella palmiformis TaxID=53620 RepID=A0AAD9N4Q9_9ANNE|nr:hypothetical protein LSH36_273g00000 [Paralvinella palmiformis]